MESGITHVLKFRKPFEFSAQFRSGVSLHSHTMHSREYLDRLPGYIAKVPIASFFIEREIGRMHLYTGRSLDFRRIFWTPPLSPREAVQLEQGQVENELGLHALTSLTDHDNVEAGLHLRMLDPGADAPVSVEWSVPYSGTVFHLGVHNLPADEANGWMEEFARFTASPSEGRLRALLNELDADRQILVVLNHPYWDAESTGPEHHQATLKQFLEGFSDTIHALEINGLRSRRENRAVLELAGELGMVSISGGDRHGCEANSVLNLTNAATFSEFVGEIREERISNVLLMPQFFDNLRVRLLESAWHALSDAPGEFGRRHWMTRVFCEDKNGVPRPVSEFTGTRFQRVVDKFRWMMALLASPQMRPAVRLAFLGSEEASL